MGSVYSWASGRIKEAQFNNEAAIDVDDLLLDARQDIDLSEMTRDDLESRFIKQTIEIALNHQKYLSLVRRAGIFINFDLMKNGKNLKAFKDKLQQNRQGDVKADLNVIEELETTYQRKKNQYPEPAFDFDEDGIPYIYEELTDGEILQAARDLCEEAKRKKAGSR